MYLYSYDGLLNIMVPISFRKMKAELLEQVGPHYKGFSSGFDPTTTRTVSSNRPLCFSILGHEGCGEVALSRRDEISVGTIVTFGICQSCGACFNCTKNSLEQKCRTLFKVRTLVLKLPTIDRSHNPSLKGSLPMPAWQREYNKASSDVNT